MRPSYPSVPLIIRNLRAGLRPVQWDPSKGHGDADWSKELFASLRALGTRAGYAVYCRPKYGGPKEMLVDMSWIQRDAQEMLQSMPFACESELDFSSNRRSKRHEDLEKLLCIRSPFKTFICQESTPTNGGATAQDHLAVLTDLESRLVTSVNAQHGDTFLFIVLNYRTKGRRFLSYLSMINRTGTWVASGESVMQVTF